MKFPPHLCLLLASGLFLSAALFSPQVATSTMNAIESLAPAAPAERSRPPQPIGPDHYLGAFRVPRTDGTADPAKKNKYAFGGDIAAADGETFWISTHTHHALVGRIAIPEPVQASSPEAFDELPIARPLAPAVDITCGRRDPKVQKSHWRMVIEDILPYGPRLHWVFHHKYNVAQTRYRILGAYNPQTKTADGPFGLIDADRQPLRDQVSGGYLARIPEKWAKRLGATLVCGGGGLPGKGDWGAGPSLFAFAPPPPGANPYTTFVETKRLLLYPFDDNRPANDRRSLEGWNKASAPFDAVWIQDTVIFVVSFGRGAVWYGQPDGGPNGAVDWFDRTKGYHAERYEMLFLFYDAADLANVARGKRPSWTPRPYAEVPVPHLMGRNLGRAQFLPIELSWDPKTERLYLVQQRVDPSRSKYDHHPLIHVYDLKNVDSIREWAAALAEESR